MPQAPRKPFDAIVIGAGAAGLMAASVAAERGRRVLLLEKNRKAGVKILMSGGTRCNLTHSGDRRGIIDAFGKQGRFLHSALAALGPEELIDIFHGLDVPTKIEATGKVFPVSDRALDVQRALLRRLKTTGGKLELDAAVTGIKLMPAKGEGGDADGSDTDEPTFAVATEGETYYCRRLLITTGGQSYPGCGTTGDGYAWAKAMGHKIVPPRPALTPLTTDMAADSPASSAWTAELQGVTTPDVQLAIGPAGAKPLSKKRGSLLFTHFGLSGPVPMDLSREVTARPDATDWQATCDFLPDVSEQTLLEELRSPTAGKKQLGGVVARWGQRRLTETLLEANNLPYDCRLAELSKAERNCCVAAFKRMPIAVSGTLGFKKAEVTAGGVDLREVDSKTMQSKRQPGLYFAGEVLDLDGPIGGYNFQAAFSTGWLAGLHL